MTTTKEELREGREMFAHLARMKLFALPLLGLLEWLLLRHDLVIPAVLLAMANGAVLHALYHNIKTVEGIDKELRE